MTRVAGSLAAAISGAVLGGALTLSLTTSARQGALPVRDAPRNPVLGDAPIPTLLAWSPGQLAPGYESAVRRLDDVRSTVAVRSGVAWLSAWRDRDRPWRTPPGGLSFPVEVAAANVQDFLAFVPPGERAQFAALEEGGAVMGRTGAAIRSVSPGGVLAFGGIRLVVRAIVDDELVGAHELLV